MDGIKYLVRDVPRAAELYEYACDQDDGSGCLGLGILVEHGLGGLAKDPKRARERYDWSPTLPAEETRGPRPTLREDSG